ncbi:MAG: GAF domain-containing protein [Anaerolineae bacterium]|nr:GAF domain-containing protein [Anaerolineae bacterium]
MTHARNLVWIFAFGVGIPLVIILALYFQTRVWQVLAVAAALFLALGCVLLAWLAFRHGRFGWVGGWLIAGVVVGYGGAHLVCQGVTTEIILSAMVLISLVGSILLPRRWRYWLATTVLFFLYVGLVNQLNPPHRFDINPTLISDMTMALSVLIGLGMIWQTIRLGGQVNTLEQAFEDLQQTDKALRRKLTEMTVLTDVGRKITSILSMEKLLSELSRLLVEMLGFYNAEIVLLQGDVLVFEAGYGGYIEPGFCLGDTLPLGKGIIGKAALLSETLLAPDVLQDSDYIAYPALPDVRAELAVPLQIQGKVRGVIDVKSDRPQGLDENDAALMEILASQVAVAIENIHLFQAERDRTVELETLRQAGLYLTSKLELEPLLEAILENALKLTEADDAHIFLYDGNALHFGAARWRGGAVHTPFTQIRGDGITYRVARNAERLVVNQMQGHPLFADSDRNGAIAGIPLRIGETVVGVMNIAFHAPHNFDEKELQSLSLLADQAAITIHNVRLFEATERQIKELSVLHAVANAAAEMTHEDALIECATDLLGQTLYPDSCGILLINPETRALEFHKSYRWSHTPTADLERLTIAAGQGITGQVVLDGRPRRVNDTELEPQYIEIAGGMRSELCVPLRSGGEIIGVVNAECARPYAFTEDDERLMMTFSHQVSVGIERVRLFAETAEALAREQHLNQFARTINQRLDIGAILSDVVRQAAQLVEADAGSLRLLSADKMSLSAPYGCNLPDTLTVRTLDRGGIAWHVVKNNVSLLLPEYSHHPQAQPEWMAAGVHACMAVPVTVGEEVFGSLTLFSLDIHRHFTARDLALTESIARHTGIAIQNARLFAQVQDRAAELSTALERLQELDKLKSEFIQNVSHELRTPLAIVRGYAELLRDGKLGELLAPQKEPVAIIARRIKMLSNLVEDLMAMMEIEAQQLQMEPLDMVSVVQAAHRDFQIQAIQGGLTLDAQIRVESAPVVGDSIKLRRVLDNLIGNALKFTPEGGTITLFLDVAGDAVLLDVADSGIGIPVEKLERIFERFYQVDGSMKRRYGGTGLGLALVKEIVEAHSGSVSVESVVGEGAVFHVRLPLHAGAPV